MVNQTISIPRSKKICTCCGEAKSIKLDFPIEKLNRDGRSGKCKSCTSDSALINRYIREGKISQVEVKNLGFATVRQKADHFRELFKVVAYRDSATQLIQKFGYQVSKKTLDRYIWDNQGLRKSSIISKSNNPRTSRDDSRYISENGNEDTILLEALAQVQSELKYVYGLEFDKHHFIPVSKGGTYNISNIRLIPSKVNKWIEEDEYTSEEINEKIANNSGDRHWKGYSWSKCLPAEEFIKLFVNQFTS